MTDNENKLNNADEETKTVSDTLQDTQAAEAATDTPQSADAPEVTETAEAEPQKEPEKTAEKQAEWSGIPQKPNRAKKPVIKTVKRIYFPIVAVLLVLVTVFGFVHAYFAAPKSLATAADLSNAKSKTAQLDLQRKYSAKAQDDANLRNYIENELKGYGISLSTGSISTVPQGDDEEPEEFFAVSYKGGTKEMNYFVSPATYKYTLSVETQEKIANKNDSDALLVNVGRQVNNILVMVPGNDTKGGAADADVILITAHMDVAKNGVYSETGKTYGGASDTAMLGVLLNEISKLKKYEKDNGEAKYDNDIAILFTDASIDANYGVYTFLDQFKGYGQAVTNDYPVNDLVSRIALAVNFDSIGSGSSSVLLQASESNGKVVSEYAKALGGMFSSSFVSDFYSKYPTDFQAFDALPALNLVTVGKLHEQDTVYDNFDSLSESVIKNKYNMLLGVLGHFGDYNLSKVEGGNERVYFSVLGMFTVSYTKVFSYVLGIILALLIAGIILANFFKKSFSWVRLAKGLGVQGLAIAATFASMFVLYFVMGLILSGFGLFTIQSMIYYIATNTGILIGFSIFALAMLSFFYSLFKGLFRVPAASVVRAGAGLWGVIGFVLSFAYPALGYMFAIPAVLVLTVMLLTTIFKDKFKARLGDDIEKMMFYLVPMIFALMLIVPVFTIISASVPMVLFPVLMLPFMLICSVALPYLSTLKPILDRVFARLPKRTVRVEKEVTERVYDKAKPDKFTETTSTKIVKEKIEWKYRHGAGMSVVAALAAIIIMISCAGSVPFGAKAFSDTRPSDYGVTRYTQSLFDSSMVLSYRRDGDSGGDAALKIADKSVYKYLRNAVNGFEWDADENVYAKRVGIELFSGITPIISDDKGAGTITVKPAIFAGLADKGVVEIVLNGTENVSTLTVADTGPAGREDDTYEIKPGGRDSVVLHFPQEANRFDEITLTIVFKTGISYNDIGVEVSQYIWDDSDRVRAITENNGIFDVTSCLNYMKDLDEPASKALKFGVYYNVTKTANWK